MDPADSRLRVQVADGHGRRVRANGLATWLRRVAPARARGTVSVALVSDDRIRALNRTYRRKNSATDVLSFSYGAWGPTLMRSRALPPALAAGASGTKTESGISSHNEQRFLGDIVIARGVARRQAREAGHSEATEVRILALHGLLHLLGYDHERDDGRMARLEEQLRREGGLREGLIRRRSVSGYTRAPRREGVERGGGAPRHKKK